jgi:hypothetical protein
MKPTVIVDASECVHHGRPRDVLRKIEEFLAFQDQALAELCVEIDGQLYHPAWVFEG